MRRLRLALGLAPAAFALQVGVALAAGATLGQPAGPALIGSPVRLVPRAETQAAPSTSPEEAAAAAASGATSVAAAAPLGMPSAGALAPRRVPRAPGTIEGDVVIEAIPASTHPAGAGPSAADPRRAFLESPAAVRLGDPLAEDDSVRLVGVREEGGTTCREYQQTIIVDSVPVQALATVCLQPDGTWKLVDR